MGINGIRFLKTQESCHKEYITRLYREHTKEEPFINRCLLIGDIYIQLFSIRRYRELRNTHYKKRVDKDRKYRRGNMEESRMN